MPCGKKAIEFAGSGTKLSEHQGGERELDRGGEAGVVLRLKHARPVLFPLPS